MTLLKVDNLKVKFAHRHGDLTAVNGVSFSLEAGQRMGIVGESGAGKSVTGFALLNLIKRPGYIESGSIHFEGRNLRELSDEAMRDLRGNRISMIFQNPMMSLNPVLKIQTQMIESLQAHQNISKSDAYDIALEALKKVAMPSPEKRLNQYPHEFSGGMRQRIVIAMALMGRPSLIIADEPTTALDVTIQAEILDLLMQLCDSEKRALVLITHDLAVVSEVTQIMAVMYAGRFVETGKTADILSNPKHPYTQGLIDSLPQNKGDHHLLKYIKGCMPSLTDIPAGCPFHPRCPLKEARCEEESPLLRKFDEGRRVACHLVTV